MPTQPTIPITVYPTAEQLAQWRELAVTQGITLEQLLVEAVDTAVARGSSR